MLFVLEGELGYAPNHTWDQGNIKIVTKKVDKALMKRNITTSLAARIDAPCVDADQPHNAAVFTKFVRAGAYLCEMSLWIDWRKEGTLIATTGCRMLSLDAKEFLR